MENVERLNKKIEEGAYDRLLSRRYGRDKLEKQRERLARAVKFFGNTYGWDRRVRIYSIPFSVILGSDERDVAIPTDIDRLAVVAENGTNVTRMRARDFTGEDNMDIFQHGPYGDEYDRTIGILRGVRQAFAKRGHRISAPDIYFDCDTLPGLGLDERAHMALSVAYIYNDRFTDSKMNDSRIAGAVQWALANYALTDGYLTDSYSSICGQILSGEYSDPENPKIGRYDTDAFDMCDCKIYMVNTGETALPMAEDMGADRSENFISLLGKDPEEAEDKEFYAALAEKGARDKGAAAYYMDWRAIDNFSRIYYANCLDGDGSPSLEQSVEEKKPTVGGAASKYHCKPYHYHGRVLCCVKNDAKEEFMKACRVLFGADSVTEVGIAKFAAGSIIG